MMNEDLPWCNAPRKAIKACPGKGLGALSLREGPCYPFSPQDFCSPCEFVHRSHNTQTPLIRVHIKAVLITLPYSIVWYQVAWTLQFYSSLSVLLWLVSLLWFHIHVRKICFSSVKNVICVMTGVALSLQIALGSLDILMMLIL